MEKGEPSPAGVSNAVGSLWWNWSPVNTTNVFLDTTGSTIDTIIAVYMGQTVSNLTEVAATNNVGSSEQAYLSFNATLMRTRAASMPSAEVPDIRPRTRREFLGMRWF